MSDIYDVKPGFYYQFANKSWVLFEDYKRLLSRVQELKEENNRLMGEIACLKSVDNARKVGILVGTDA